MSANTAIPVYQSVRSIGVIKPVFDSSINGFQPPTLQVYGTGFWVKEYRCFVTCAHVVDGVLKSSIEQTTGVIGTFAVWNIAKNTPKNRIAITSSEMKKQKEENYEEFC